MGFISAVNSQPGIGVPGDFASANPRAVSIGSSGQYKAGSAGVYVGRFCWITNGRVYNTGVGKPDGFVGRHQNGVIVAITDEYSTLIPAGQLQAVSSPSGIQAG